MGPLKGVKVVEMGGIGPSPFCCMILSDMGADVIRVDRNKQHYFTETKYDYLLRGRRSMVLNVTGSKGKTVLLKLLKDTDVIIEGFRPGKMEKLGLSPAELFKLFPRLIYGRMTGWGQYGPLSRAAGHDINYISVTGALNAMGEADSPPSPPLNLVGDFGGGGALLAMGVVSALYEREKSGEGQVVDAAMTDGASLLTTMIYGMRRQGVWSDKRGENILDGGSHFYGVYETADRKYVSVGSIEPQFYGELLRLTGVTDPEFQEQLNSAKWHRLKEKFKTLFKTKTRDEWCAVLEGTDACFAPVLSMDEAPFYPHNIARNTFVNIDGEPHPAPAPRFSRTASEIKGPPVEIGVHTEEILKEMNMKDEEVEEMKNEGVIF